MAKLTIEGLCKSYGATEVLHDIELQVEDGEFCVFVGPSGCGKSTLLRLICGLDEVTSGRLVIDDEIVNDVPSSKRGIAMVFQTYALYPHMNVAANMGYALKLAGTPREEIDARVREAAEILQIAPLLGRRPRELSGGQRQRVAIGRAIVREPRIFLFDEPLSNLDAALRVDMRMEFARLKDRLGTTMIYVTHDQTEAMTLADKIVVMRAGRVEQVGGPIELYEAPVNRFVAGFIGSPKMNFLPARIEGERVMVPGGEIRLAERPGGLAELGVRPEHIRAGDDGAGTVTGRVAATEHLGSDTYAMLDVDGLDRPLVLRLSGERRIDHGERLTATFDAEAAYLFDGEGRSLGGARARADAA